MHLIRAISWGIWSAEPHYTQNRCIPAVDLGRLVLEILMRSPVVLIDQHKAVLTLVATNSQGKVHSTHKDMRKHLKNVRR